MCYFICYGTLNSSIYQYHYCKHSLQLKEIFFAVLVLLARAYYWCFSIKMWDEFLLAIMWRLKIRLNPSVLVSLVCFWFRPLYDSLLQLMHLLSLLHDPLSWHYLFSLSFSSSFSSSSSLFLQHHFFRLPIDMEYLPDNQDAPGMHKRKHDQASLFHWFNE